MNRQTPYVVVYDSKTSTIRNRLFEPFVKLKGRFPRCDFATAVAYDPDELKLYGVPYTTFLYHDDDAPLRPGRPRAAQGSARRMSSAARRDQATEQHCGGCGAGAAIPCGSFDREVRGDRVTDNEKRPRRTNLGSATSQEVK